MEVLNQKFMTTITLELSEAIKTKYNFWSHVWFDEFTQKVFGDDFVSPDLSSTPLSELSPEQKNVLNKAQKYDSSLLVNL